MNYFDVLTRFLGFRITKYGPKPHIDFIKNKYKNKELIGAEIGVWMAENSVQIFKNLNIKKLYLIDPWGEDLNYNEKDKLNKSKFAYNISMFRLNKRDANYLNYVQPWQNHTHDVRDGMYMYSFSNNPEEYQPSGSVNFGRISAYLACSLTNEMMDLINSNLNPDIITGAKISVFTLGINILRFVNGRGGVSYEISS